MFDFSDILTGKVSDGYSFVTEELVSELKDVIDYYGFDEDVNLHAQGSKLYIDITPLDFQVFDLFFTVLYQVFKYHTDNPFDILRCVEMIDNAHIDIFRMGKSHIDIMGYEYGRCDNYNSLLTLRSRYVKLKLHETRHYRGKAYNHVNDMKYLVFLIRCSQMVYEQEYKNLGPERLKCSPCSLNSGGIYPMSEEELIEFVKILVETEDLINPPKEIEKYFYDGITDYIFITGTDENLAIFQALKTAFPEYRTMSTMDLCKKFCGFLGYINPMEIKIEEQ